MKMRPYQENAIAGAFKAWEASEGATKRLTLPIPTRPAQGELTSLVEKYKKGLKMSMKAYKGFNKDMTCRDFQYKEGGEVVEVAE